MQLRYALTPLTTFVVDTDFGRDRFELTNLRDADSLGSCPGSSSSRLALISGRVFVGYRQFEPLTEELPDYSGVVAAVDAAYIHGTRRASRRRSTVTSRTRSSRSALLRADSTSASPSRSG